jgi:hypothetical protein
MAISLSLVLVLGIAVWLVHKYGHMKIWHGLISATFGFYLAGGSFAPAIRTTLTAILHAFSGVG